MRPDRGETAGVGLQPGATCPFVGPQGLGSRTRPVLVGTARGGDEKRSIAVSRVGTIHSPTRPRLVISPRANVKSWERRPPLGCPSTPCYRRYSVDQMRQSPAPPGRSIAIYRQSPRNCDRATAIRPRLGLQISSFPISSSCTTEAPPISSRQHRRSCRGLRRDRTTPEDVESPDTRAWLTVSSQAALTVV
jgi:hypothetical protein